MLILRVYSVEAAVPANSLRCPAAGLPPPIAVQTAAVVLASPLEAALHFIAIAVIERGMLASAHTCVSLRSGAGAACALAISLDTHGCVELRGCQRSRHSP